MSSAYPFIDLHTHSAASDGSDSPTELARKAAAKGLLAFALTDHDTMDGLDEAEREARRLNLRFVRGIEIAVRDSEEGELHLLGLFMPQPSARMREALSDFVRNREERNRGMLEALHTRGMDISMGDLYGLAGGGTVGRPHIAQSMKLKGYVHSRREAFERYLGLAGEAFVPRRLMSMEEGLALLRGEGAITVLAHPCLGASMTAQRLEKLLAEGVGYGLDAVEAYHSSHTPQKTRLCVDLAAKYNLLLSGGSDYHGRHKMGIKLGSGLNGNVRVPLAVLEKMDAYRRNQGAPAATAG